MAIENLSAYEGHDLVRQNPGLLRVLQIFDRISSFARPSKKEEAVRQSLIEFAHEQGWETQVDETGNLAVRVPATPGKEGLTPILLQGHMDIVVTPEDHMQPRLAEIIDKGEEGDEIGLWMQTKGQNMTLGSDNGIGVSLAMATMLDPEIEHGPVTLLLTVDEETGMTGAINLDPNLLPETGILLNLDSEAGPMDICIGCAGSTDIQAKFPIGDRESIPESHNVIDLNLTGLLGGHSGIDIHNGRGNAIQSMARLLQMIQTETEDLRLINLSGGSARNAIPSKAFARVSVPAEKMGAFESTVRSFVEDLKRGENPEDPTVTGQLLAKNATKVECTWDVVYDIDPISSTTSVFRDRFLATLSDLPTGPFTSAELPNVGKLVTLSNNLGVASMDTENADIITMARGANIGELKAKLEELRRILETKGATVTAAEPTAGWLENPETSPAVLLASQAVQDVLGEVRFLAYHAGLESGIVTDKAIGNMSAVSLGPLIKEAHTPRERVSLESTTAVLGILKEIFRIHTKSNPPKEKEPKIESFEIEPGEKISYKNLYGVEILSFERTGWLEISLEGNYRCSLKLEKTEGITKLTIRARNNDEILAYDRGTYESHTTSEGHRIEEKIREIFFDTE